MLGRLSRYIASHVPLSGGLPRAKPVLYLHIGLPKTGSTSIQRFLRDNREHFLRQGVLYPTTGLHGPGHMQLAWAFTGRAAREHLRDRNPLPEEKGDERTRDAILNEVGAAKPAVSSVVISSEGLASAGADGIDKLFSIFEPYFDIEVICFLRRQDFMAESLHSQAYRVRNPCFKREHTLRGTTPILNYGELLENWALRAGSDRLSVFEYPENVDDFRIIETVKAALGLESLDLPIKPRWMNQRLSRDGLEYIWAHTNLVYGETPYFDVIRALQEYGALNPTPDQYTYFYSPTERRQILDHFEPTNQRVSDLYFQGNLFASCPAIQIDEPWEEYPGLDANRIREIETFLTDRGIDTDALKQESR